MSQAIIIPAIYQGSRDLADRTKKLTFQTNEITPETAAGLQLMVQEFVYLAIKKEDFRKEEINAINDLKADFNDIGKSPAQRLRAVFYRLWEQNHEGYDDFNLYYAFNMERLIERFKANLI